MSLPDIHWSARKHYAKDQLGDEDLRHAYGHVLNSRRWMIWTARRRAAQVSGGRSSAADPLPSPRPPNYTTSSIAITLSSGYDNRHSEWRDMSGYRIDRQVTEFGEHVRGWRMVLGLTAQQVSERAGITRDTLRKIESGNPNVSFNSVTQVLRALGILDQLVDAADPLASDIGRLRAGRLTRKRAR